MNKQIIITGAIFGALAVIAGAFGAHGLQALLTPKRLQVWQTAVTYQFYHVFALLFLSTFTRFKNNLIVACYYFFTIGIIFFCGSLYLLSVGPLIKLTNIIWLGPITPLGGLLFIIGWITMGFAAFRNK
jgi:uncharacterized membrane protein YgdD (TMEM256/DUF423 family)